LIERGGIAKSEASTSSASAAILYTSFKHLPFCRQTQKSGPLGTTNYLYDGDSLVGEVDQSGNVLARYTQGGPDEPVVETRSGTNSFYEEDGLKSITSLSDPSGALANTYIYDSFGNVIASTGALTNPFQYTGRDFDPETGLRFYRARYYDPQIGRFLSDDPSRFLTAWNLYAYVDNDPVDYTDMWGLQKNGTPGAVATTAASHRGSQDWLVSKGKENFKPNSDKCNLFVYDSIVEAGAGSSIPLRHILFGGPPAAGDWANPKIEQLGCWQKVSGPARPGDVIAAYTDPANHPTWAHVGIVVSVGNTASANTVVSPPGLITINDWGFASRPGQGTSVIRRCMCCPETHQRPTGLNNK
jgi:RHS repeat-associated protein